MKIDFLPMEALSVPELPRGKDWVYEPKWDGFRCLALKNKKTVRLISKSGKSLNRYFPDIVDMLTTVPLDKFLFDGEIVMFMEDGLSFADLQLRLHPAATRVTKLAKEHPASFIVFDLLGDAKGKSLLSKNFGERRACLVKTFNGLEGIPNLQLSPTAGTVKAAEKWLSRMKGTIDGLVAKDTSETYQPGARIMQKYKPVKTADCVVGGFRYAANSKLIGSLLLGLYDETGKLNHVGFTSSFAKLDKPGLTKRLEKLKGGVGFSGKAPGGPSRWSTERSTQWVALKPELVAEVSFDHVSDNRFRHGTKLIRFREDKAPSRCGMDQLDQ